MVDQSKLDRMNGRDKFQSAAHRRSATQEHELAKRGGGQRTPGSGNGQHKGDVIGYNGILRLEAKTTTKKSFSVTREMVRKIEEASMPVGELPAIVIEFIDDEGNPEMEVAVVPMYVLDSVRKPND